MNSQVAIYDSQKKAFNAIKVLNKYRFPLNRVSLIGKAEIIDDNLHITNYDNLVTAPVLLGSGAGIVAGLLSGIGVFAVPGFGFLFGAGALIGTIAGFDLGLIGGGVMSLLMRIGISEESAVKYEEHLKKGMFMLVVHGTLEEIEKAEKILHTVGTHLEWGNNKQLAI